MTEYKDTTNRHLKHKLQSLGRRLDELEEATCKLQKAEDELLDLQDKIIQSEGSNSILLSDVEALRKRVLKIEGKDEEVRKAEDLCRLIKEKLEEEENLTKELKAEIEYLQCRMTEMEKLEEAFGKSKSECTQLCHSLNEEKNLSKKLFSELEVLRSRVKEVDFSEARLNRVEQALNTEMEKLKCLTKTFAIERKKLLEKQKEDEKIILKLTEKLELQKCKLGLSDSSCNELWIEDDLSAGLSNKFAQKKSLDYVKCSHESFGNISENEKHCLEGQEDNKVKDLTQELEKLKIRLKQLEMVEEDLKNMDCKNAELEEMFQQERSRSHALRDELEQLKIQLFTGSVSRTTNVFENGKPETEINIRRGLIQEKLCYKGVASGEPVISRYKNRDVSPQQCKLKNKEIIHSSENSPRTLRRAQSPAHRSKKTGLKLSSSTTSDSGLKTQHSVVEEPSSAPSSMSKKVSVLSRYPPAACDQKLGKASAKLDNIKSKKSRIEKVSRLYTGSDSESNNSDAAVNSSNKVVSLSSTKQHRSSEPESLDPSQETVLSLFQENGCCTAYTSNLTAQEGYSEHGSEGHSSASDTESTVLKHSLGELDTGAKPTDTKLAMFSQCQNNYLGGTTIKRSYIEEQHRPLSLESGSQESVQTSIGNEIKRACSQREGLCSKAVIKPVITEYDRKEIMSGGIIEMLPTTEKPMMLTKPNKMTSSITFYPNDPSTFQTSSQSSNVSSDTPSKERHTSTSNIVIGPSTDLRGGICIPYEISIPKSEITLRQNEGDSDYSNSSNVLDTACIETSVLSQNSFSVQPAEINSDFINTEFGPDSSGSIATTAVTSWKSNSSNRHSSVNINAPDTRNVTVRNAWKNQGAVSLDHSGQRPRQGGLDDESTTTWRAYRATTVLDTDETLHKENTTRSGKPSPAETYMLRISSGKDCLEPVPKNKHVVSILDSALRRCIPHEPVCGKKLQARSRKEPTAVDTRDSSSWRKQVTRGRGSWTEGSRPWSSRHVDN
ncbi:leucine zipper protein 1 [Trichomycterus rosablanca]|uniref:leucine zipper protein 1 n=1 Tax=Trichomycterus rosablanca TaxID=2290929 RepID=UPI002F3574A2